jgi:hypothetical protein
MSKEKYFALNFAWYISYQILFFIGIVFYVAKIKKSSTSGYLFEFPQSRCSFGMTAAFERDREAAAAGHRACRNAAAAAFSHMPTCTVVILSAA